jgi:aryl-alcohol dehydrogenase-like predicted oxidoreductase
MKIVLGSVQFGLKYGINNSLGIPNDAEVSAILNTALENNINTIDTASAYGNAESRLGELGNGQFKFISKFPLVNSISEIDFHFSQTLKDLRSESIYGYMAHNADSLIDHPDYWKFLQKLKSESKVQKIGYSLYTPEQLDKLLSINCIPDIVQLPYSLLDRKFESKFKLLASLNTEIHSRSVFLQGLYFKDPSTVTGKLGTIRERIIELHVISRKYAIPMAALALSFVLHQEYIDKVVIGIDSVQQLKENIENVFPYEKIKMAIEEIKSINIENPELLNPANW